jgi:23S rRNA (adenine2503-C2)-methyltransferase
MPARFPALELDELAAALGGAARARRVLRWLHAEPALPARLPAALAGVAGPAWTAFARATAWRPPRIAARRESADGTVKYALAFAGASVETVRIPSAGRSTICVSSQAGCTRRCAFCATQTLGFTRQLAADEIVAQFLVARAEAPADAPARNVVFMGMGEPMDNLDEVLRAVRVLTQGPAPQLRARSVTVSTSGVLPGMVRFLRESDASLALSLNATTDATRAALMPHDRVWPIAALLECLRADARVHPRRLTFVEYLLCAGVNDGDADADRLVALLDGVPARVNLIPHNPFPGSPFAAPDAARVLAFRARVVARGRRCMVRAPRGRDIAAACGQLVLAERADGFAGDPPTPRPEATTGGTPAGRRSARR